MSDVYSDDADTQVTEKGFQLGVCQGSGRPGTSAQASLWSASVTERKITQEGGSAAVRIAGWPEAGVGTSWFAVTWLGQERLLFYAPVGCGLRFSVTLEGPGGLNHI